MNIKTFLNKHGLKFYIGFMVLLVGLFSFGPAFSKIASAMPETFCNQNANGSGTSTPVYLTAGGSVATTTLYASKGCSSDIYGVKQFALLNVYIGSSTLTVFQTRQEFAHSPGLGVDCISTPTNCEWYAASFTTVQGFATTTGNPTPTQLVLETSAVPVYTYRFASSTQAGTGTLLGPAGLNNRNQNLVLFPATVTYTRWVVSLAPGSTPGAYYGSVVGRKEIGER